MPTLKQPDPASSPPFVQVLAALACLVASAVSTAASIDAGQALYTANCVGCHGTPPNGMKIDNLAAANRPDIIRFRIQTVAQMDILRELSDDDLANIATYLANPTTNDADCIFGWSETLLPTLLAPRTFSAMANGFDYRYYPPAHVYLGITTSATDNRRHLYFLDAHANYGVLDIGSINGYLDAALTAGCP